MEKKISFENAIEELQQITDKLENDETTLSEALKLYEKGVSLVRVCKEQLNDAEQKVKIIQKENGLTIEKDF